MILIHGRGATAPSILELAQLLHREDTAYLAPQASGNTWYPYSFLNPIEQNEPGLSSGLQAIADVLAQVEGAGIPAEKVIIGGFSRRATGFQWRLDRSARHATHLPRLARRDAGFSRLQHGRFPHPGGAGPRVGGCVREDGG